MAGVTSLWPQTNDPPGPLDRTTTCPEQTLPQKSQVPTKISDTPTVPYVRDSMCKLSVDNNDHNDDETVKTANSSTFNTDSTIETDILYENEPISYKIWRNGEPFNEEKERFERKQEMKILSYLETKQKKKLEN